MFKNVEKTRLCLKVLAIKSYLKMNYFGRSKYLHTLKFQIKNKAIRKNRVGWVAEICFQNKNSQNVLRSRFLSGQKGSEVQK